jgi:hypothetical protein
MRLVVLEQVNDIQDTLVRFNPRPDQNRILRLSLCSQSQGAVAHSNAIDLYILNLQLTRIGLGFSQTTKSGCCLS